MKNGIPYFEYAIRFKMMLKEHGLRDPRHLYQTLKVMMDKDTNPSESECNMVFYGQRTFPDGPLIFLQDHFNFKPAYTECYPAKNTQGQRLKTNQLALPGIKEFKR